jgi:hypothetical protein
MEICEPVVHPDDVAYVKANFMPLEPAARREGYPSPSYVLEDGSWYVPLDYFEQEVDPQRFRERYIREATTLDLPDPHAAAADEWNAFLTGVYGVCLREVTPENIARKAAFIRDIEMLTANPAPDRSLWTQALRKAVNGLDALEREFSPVYDRERFERPPTRDSHIAAIRERFGL